MYRTNLSGLLIVSLLFVSFVTAQKTAPQTKSSVRDTWKEFVSEEGGFKAKFPVAPTRVVTKIQAGFGTADFIQYRVVTRNLQYVVGFMDFPAPVTDQDELKFRYDGAVTNVLSKSGNRLVSTGDVFVNDYLGREAIFESPTLFQAQRAFIVNQRFFALSVVLPLTKATTAKNKLDYNDHKAKLFESFAVTKIPAANFAGLSLPEDVGSSVKGNNYRSSYFGFSMTLPDGFSFFEKEQLDTLKEMSVNEAGLNDESESEKVRFSIKRMVILTGAITENRSALIVAAELPSFPNMTLEAISAEIAKEQKKNLDEKVIKESHPVMLDGVKSYGVITQNYTDKLKQYVIITKRKELVFQIVFSYREDSELEEFTRLLESVKFDKQ